MPSTQPFPSLDRVVGGLQGGTQGGSKGAKRGRASPVGVPYSYCFVVQTWGKEAHTYFDAGSSIAMVGLIQGYLYILLGLGLCFGFSHAFDEREKRQAALDPDYFAEKRHIVLAWKGSLPWALAQV